MSPWLFNVFIDAFLKEAKVRVGKGLNFVKKALI